VDIAGNATVAGNAVRDDMDILGNPDLLKLWCDPIHALVITKSSEGAQNAANRGNLQHDQQHHQQQHHQNQRQTSSSDREYEGEWIEATTPALEAPCAGYVQRANSTLAYYLGFPTYGKVTMFVERGRGRVGLTIGPFAGGITVSHNLQILQCSDGSCEDGGVASGKIRIVDDVKLRQTAGSDHYFCGILEKCYAPRLEDFMDSVLSSMARLRFLVEKGQGEHSMYVEASVGCEHGTRSDGCFNHTHTNTESEAFTPLLMCPV
jgi:hypothetical protein